MSQFQTILDKVNATDLSNRTRGSIFERLCVHLLQDKDTQGEYKSIKLWNDWEHKGSQKDIGIDIVIETHSGEFIAVQCKFYTQGKLQLHDLATYFTLLQSGVGDIRFSKGILISTTDLGKEVENAIYQINKQMPLEMITLQDFLYSSIDWEKFDPTKPIETHARKTPLPHQKEALKKIDEYFADVRNTRGKLIMACGTGKTFVALKATEMLTDANDSITLFLAPSIALVGQSLREFAAQKTQSFIACVVCSDSTAARGEDDLDPRELPIPPSTSPSAILESYHKAKSARERLVIFSTYQSLERIKQAQILHKLPPIDLIICDEAHRSVGSLYTTTIKGQAAQDIKIKNAFTLCHDNDSINAKRRIYMTATPKIYSNTQKTRAKDKDNEVFSMDDEAIFGKTIYEMRFGKAVQEGLLTDYKVIILALEKETYAQVANKAIAKLKESGINKLNEKLVDLEFVCKIIGTHKGLVKSDLITLDSSPNKDIEYKTSQDSIPSQKALNFCRNIATSKNIKESFQAIIDCYDEEMRAKTREHTIHIDHIDGTMNANTRFEKLSELEKGKPKTCELITNAKCLSEGVDIPALDSVVFFDGRSAMVDIIQAVGRVMRKAPGKEIGYIILPIALSEKELNNLDKAVDNTNFKNIWNILKALRSHDESLVSEASFREKIKIAMISDHTSQDTNPNKRPTASQQDKEKAKKDKEAKEHIQRHLFEVQRSLNDIADSIYNVLPTKLGDKHYWSSFSAKTGKIVQDLTIRLNAYFKDNPSILSEFVESLQEAIHPNIKEAESIDMLASHIVTKPIFDTIFGEIMGDNPIGNALDSAFERLKSLGLDNEESKELDTLYKSIKESVEIAKTDGDKQRLIKDLYDTFFKTAFKKQSERLGIVYTPIEVIDFILHSTNALLQRHFGTDFNDSQVKVFDAFTGTGSFIARLLSKENALIDSSTLQDRYNHGIYAQDINILAYYIALINITQTAQSRDPSLDLFSHIALADSLNYLEDKQDYGLFSDYYKDLLANKQTQDFIAKEPIQVFIGNPPYSSGQGSQNDNNANLPHPKLEKRAYDTYSILSANIGSTGKTTRDTLIQSIRMASDRVLKEGWGVVGFVVNGGFIDAKSADGFRKCLSKEFEDIYIINLRGNQRTSGEISQQEGGKIFDIGSRASVSLLFLVKSKETKESKLHYFAVGDYWDRQKKLDFLVEKHYIKNIDFYNIAPNDRGDWINQHHEHYYTLLPLKLEKAKGSEAIFRINSNGIATNRDSWVWNFDTSTLQASMQKCIATYNENLARFDKETFLAKHEKVKKSELYKMLTHENTCDDESKISWTRNLKKAFLKDEKAGDFMESKVRIATYRPFVKSYVYYDELWNEEQSQLNKIYPTAESKNLTIATGMMGGRDFSSFITNTLIDIQCLANSQTYPLYYYTQDLEGKYQREYAITRWGLEQFHNHYKDKSINEEDIFYYIYAIFNHKSFVAKYKANLSKDAPRVPFSKHFERLSKLGRELAELHLGYENGEKFTPSNADLLLDSQEDSYFYVTKMAKVGDGSEIYYNENLSIKGIPLKAYSYVLNQKSAIDWIIERYQIINTDQTSNKAQIPNNPNLFSGSRYIYDLLLRVINLSIKSVDVIESISKLEFEA